MKDSGLQAKIDYKLNNDMLSKQELINMQRQYTAIRAIEPLITKDMENLSVKFNTNFTGLEYSVKTANSLQDKLQRLYQKKSVESVKLSQIQDIIRYTEICNHDDISEVAKKTINELENNGYKLSSINNYFIHPYPGTQYRGLHLNFLSPYGQPIELQVHSQTSFDAKMEGHKLYEQARSVSTPAKEKERLYLELQKIHSSFKNPKDIETIPNKIISPEERKEFLMSLEKVNIQMACNVDNKKDVSVLSYNVNKGSSQLLFGCEIHQSDNSVVDLKRFENNDNLHVSYIGKSGDVTLKEDINCLEINSQITKFSQNTASKLCQIGIKNEEINKDWTQGTLKIDDNNKDFKALSKSIFRQVEQIHEDR